MSLFDAVLAGDRESLESQLASGEDPNPFDEEGLTPLMVAARAGQSELVRVLVAGGADPTITNPLGESALVIAAANGHAESCRHLTDGASEDELAMVRALLKALGVSGPGYAPSTPPKDDFRRKLASAGAYVAGKLGDHGATKRLERALRSEKQRKP